jgi:MoaA/NifB/PqqE/SkfB family radical SAM enzyme
MISDMRYRLARRVPILGANKYFLAVTSYLTWHKLLSILRCERHRRRRIIRPQALPYIAILDVTNVCNLRCPYCPTGAGISSGRRPSKMTVEDVTRLAEEFGDQLLIAYLFNWGEPLLNPDIASIVDVLHRKRVFTCISSNLSIKLIDRLLDACDAGLDYIMLSIDGTTPETYGAYRRRGNFEVVLENVKRLVEHRRLRRARNPVIEWQFLEFRFNRHERSLAEEMAKKLGVDVFRARPGSAPEEDSVNATLPSADEEKGAESRDKRVASLLRWLDLRLTGGALTAHGALSLKKSDGGCDLLWRSVTINADLGVAPCCYMYRKENDFGDLDEGGLKAVWHGERYVQARSLFNKEVFPELPKNLMHPCLRCPVTSKLKHLDELVKLNRRSSEDRSGFNQTDRESQEKRKIFDYPL